ncbi:MAG: peptidoglycan-binding domain-containing protein [Acidobacteriota bacterium]|nr:peptidoglycan-binding domain-containing protein [Acidobacteriota bacterium]
MTGSDYLHGSDILGEDLGAVTTVDGHTLYPGTRVRSVGGAVGTVKRIQTGDSNFPDARITVYWDAADYETDTALGDLRADAVGMSGQDFLYGEALNQLDQIFGEVTIPKAGQNYTDKATVLAVQKALKAKGFDPGKIDGIYGPKTAGAIQQMQGSLNVPTTGVIDEGVIATLGVTPGGTAVAPKPSIFASIKDAIKPLPAVGPPGTPTLAAAGFWSQPLWTGAPVKRWAGLVGGIGGAAIITGVVLAVRR